MPWIKTSDRQPDAEGDYYVHRVSASPDKLFNEDFCAWIPNEPGKRRLKGAWTSIKTGSRLYDVQEWFDDGVGR